jgi:hypothetical protein
MGLPRKTHTLYWNFYHVPGTRDDIFCLCISTKLCKKQAPIVTTLRMIEG